MAYEDFTTYTKVDEGGDITVESATKVSWVALKTQQETGYLYKDKGSNYFDGDFTHKFEMQFGIIGDKGHSFNWMLANTVADWQAIYDASGDSFAFLTFDNIEIIYLRLTEGGSLLYDAWLNPLPQAFTTYYIEIVRDDDGGANSTGRLTTYIRTGSHSGVLQDTLVVDCSAGQQKDYRYVYAVTTNDRDYYKEGLVDGFTQNLDLGAAPPPLGWTGKINGVTNPAKINGIAVADIASVMGQ